MVSLNEELLSVAEAAKILPGRPNVATVWRWISRGCKGIRLEVFRSGGRTYTSRQALERFSARLSGQAESPAPTARAKRVAAAEAELAAAGI